MKDPKDNLRELRKHENSMLISGVAVIAFSLWTIIKSGLMILMTPEDFKAQVNWNEITGQLKGEDHVTVVITAVSIGIMIAILMGIDLAIRFSVGLAARREGMGEGKMKKRHIILAILLTMGMILSVTSSILNIVNGEDSLADESIIVAIIIEITALTACLQLLYSLRKVRKLKSERG